MKGILIAALATLLVVTTTPVFAEKSKSMNPNSYTIDLGDGILLQMTVAPFDAKKHKIKKCQILDWSGVCLIDSKPVFGTDWELPKNQLIKATLKVGVNSVNLDVSCMYNPWFGKPDPQAFTLGKAEGGYLIKGSFSDGAGSYEAEWLIIQNSSVRTRLANKEC
jgi:hypothetical protein